MAELRRLLVKQGRIKELNNDWSIDLLPKEAHYLTRVLRLRNRDCILITDGLGNLWKANLMSNNKLILNSSFNSPIQKKPLLKPLICLAVVIPRKGFDDILQMSCEIGADVFQPLISERSVNKRLLKGPYPRWELILNEAIEQSERLWKPELRKIQRFNDWVLNCPRNMSFSIGATRQKSCQDFESWLNTIPIKSNEVWVAIGPEGGWTQDEFKLAINQSFEGVFLGDTIMRTSTAAISASQLMASWRRMVK